MVRKLGCECAERYEAKIDTWALFEEIKKYFEEQVSLGIYKDIPARKPFYIGYLGPKEIKWYADKWYKCNNCGCLWEFVYPDFPGTGFVRKFPDGVYRKESD